MLFGQNQIDSTKDEHLRRMATLARDSTTLVVFDTNILAYLFKLHSAARQEFFDWTAELVDQERLCIPSWAANEYLNRVMTGELNDFTPKTKSHDQPKNALETMLETATLFVDDKVLRAISFAGNRAAYLAEFRRLIEALPKVTAAFKHQFDHNEIHDEIVSNLSSSILGSDLVELCQRASIVGDARFEHRLPPAFCDAAKERNRFGDLIIWFELLQHSTVVRDRLTSVLLVTNDEKKDWVYAPQRCVNVIRGARKPVANTAPSLKIADPRLVAEFTRVVGHSRIDICSLPSLIEGFSKVIPSKFGQLAAAIQIDLEAASTDAREIQPENGQPEEVANDTGESAPPAVVDQEPEVNAAIPAIPIPIPIPMPMPMPMPAGGAGLQDEVNDNVGAAEDVLPTIRGHVYGASTLQDSTYLSDAPSKINDVITSLKSHNWYIQNPAVDKIRTLVDEEFSPDSWFVLGRNLYQAACGNAQKAMNYLANLETNLSRLGDQGQHLFAGMLYEIYFDSEGVFRESPKSEMIDKPLSVVVGDDYQEVLEFMRQHLAPHSDQMSFVPGDTQEFILRIQSEAIVEVENPPPHKEKRMATSVLFSDIELLVDLPQGDPGWLSMTSFTVDSLVKQLSEQLAVPRWAIQRHFEPAVTTRVSFEVPAGKHIELKNADTAPAN